MHAREIELDIGFLEDAFEELQQGDFVKTIARAKIDKKLIDKEQAIFTRQLKILAGLIQEKNPRANLSAGEAWEILRREHIKYFSRYFVDIRKDFQVSDQGRNHAFISQQEPIGSPRNCYSRAEVGLPGFRCHTLRKADDTLLIKYFHHSSPVPYEIKNFEKRIEATIENFKQVVRETGGRPVTEIRLISTNKGVGGDYKQVFDTYLAALRSDQPISLFFYGVNLARFLRSPLKNLPFYDVGLQTWINTRAKAELFGKVFEKLGIRSSGELNNLQRDLERKRRDLEIEVKALNLLETKEVIEEKFNTLLREHHKNEKAVLKKFKEEWVTQRRPLDPENALIYHDVNLFLELSNKRKYLDPENNGQIQAILVRLHCRLGDTVVTGCNDAKDRDGMVSIVIEANEIYRDIYGRYPDLFNPDVVKELAAIQDEVFKHSTPVPMAESVSMPGFAKGLDNTDAPFSGFGHFPNEKGFLAGIFKRIYGAHPVPLNFKYKPKKQASSYEKIKQRLFGEEKPSDDTLKIEGKKHLEEAGTFIKVVVFDEKKQEFISYAPDKIPHDIDSDAMNCIQVFENKIEYQPSGMPTDEGMLKKILRQMVIEAMDMLEPENIEDLNFKANKDVKEMLHSIALEVFARRENPMRVKDDRVEESGPALTISM